MSSLALTNKCTWLKLSKFLYPSDSRHTTVNDVSETHTLSVNTKERKPAPPPLPASTRSGMLTSILLESCAILSINCTVFHGYDPFKAVQHNCPARSIHFSIFRAHTVYAHDYSIIRKKFFFLASAPAFSTMRSWVAGVSLIFSNSHFLRKATTGVS